MDDTLLYLYGVGERHIRLPDGGTVRKHKMFERVSPKSRGRDLQEDCFSPLLSV